MRRHGSASRHVDAPPDVVFERITDLAGLPAWNHRMTAVVEVPSRLAVGEEWVVSFRLGGRRFNSRSVVVELDEGRRRFVHRSKPTDDNPSCTVWTWEVTPEGDGSRVSVQWDMRPVTPARRFLAAPIRAWQIPRRDIPDSLASLADACERIRP